MPLSLIITLIVIVAAVPIAYGFFIGKKLNDFLKNNPSKAFIAFLGSERREGVYVHRVLSQSLDNEYKRTALGQMSGFTVNAGEVELEIEWISQSHNVVLNKITYTYNGKVQQKFFTEPGKKYTLKYDKKTQQFFLKG
nr:hypothetical protein [Pedobacter sp. ASV2]